MGLFLISEIIVHSLSNCTVLKLYFYKSRLKKKEIILDIFLRVYLVTKAMKASWEQSQIHGKHKKNMWKASLQGLQTGFIFQRYPQGLPLHIPSVQFSLCSHQNVRVWFPFLESGVKSDVSRKWHQVLPTMVDRELTASVWFPQDAVLGPGFYGMMRKANYQGSRPELGVPAHVPHWGSANSEPHTYKYRNERTFGCF